MCGRDRPSSAVRAGVGWEPLTLPLRPGNGPWVDAHVQLGIGGRPRALSVGWRGRSSVIVTAALRKQPDHLVEGVEVFSKI